MRFVEEQIQGHYTSGKLPFKELAEKMKYQPSAIVQETFLQEQVVTVTRNFPMKRQENIAMSMEHHLRTGSEGRRDRGASEGG